MNQALTHMAYKAQRAAQPQWISEEEAAKLLNLTPGYMRRQVKAGAVPVNYSSPTGRNYKYNKTDIDKYLLDHSTIVN